MIKNTVIAALFATVSVKGEVQCTDDYTLVTAEEKVKADSALKVAETLLATATELREDARGELPAAQQGIADYEATISQGSFTEASAALQ